MAGKAPHDWSNWLADKVKMLLMALVLGALGLGAFLTADIYHIDPAWVFLALLSLSFFPSIAWGYRAHFRSAAFLLFLAAWMVLHGIVFVVVMRSFGWLYYFAAIFLELFIFYLTVHWFFRLQLPSGGREHE